MSRCPLFIELEGLKVLVVGCGTVGSRRARTLRSHGASVTVLDPRPARPVPKGCRHLRRRFRPSDARGRFLVVAATDDPRENLRVAAEARAAGALVNLASDARASEVWMPAAFRRGPVTVAVVTGGLSPSLARLVRDQIEFGCLSGLRMRGSSTVVRKISRSSFP